MHGTCAAPLPTPLPPSGQQRTGHPENMHVSIVPAATRASRQAWSRQPRRRTRRLTLFSSFRFLRWCSFTLRITLYFCLQSQARNADRRTPEQEQQPGSQAEGQWVAPTAANRSRGQPASHLSVIRLDLLFLERLAPMPPMGPSPVQGGAAWVRQCRRVATGWQRRQAVAGKAAQAALLRLPVQALLNAKKSGFAAKERTQRRSPSFTLGSARWHV